MDPPAKWTKWGRDIAALASNKAKFLSALDWLAHHSCSAESARISLHYVSLGTADSPVFGLSWPELRAASVCLSLAPGAHRKLGRDWLRCLLSRAENLQALSLHECIDAVPLFTGLKHLCMRLPSHTATAAPDWDAHSFAATVSALPSLETLEVASFDCFFSHSLGGLDLETCPKLCRVSLDNMGPASLALPKNCNLLLAMDSVWLHTSEYPGIEPVAHVWKAWAERVLRLYCINFCQTGHDAVMDMVGRFTCLERLEIQDPWDAFLEEEEEEEESQPIPLLDFTGCHSLANVTVLKVIFRSSDCSEGRGVSLLIPAAWRLKMLVVASWDKEGARDAVELTFQDPELAAQCLEDLFVPGPELTGHLLLMTDAFMARGLMLSAAKCRSAEAGYYVFLKELAAAPSSFAALFEKYMSACDCGVCARCCLGGVDLGDGRV